MEGIQTFNGSWPWPWPWIRPYGIPSCITHRPLPIYQISLKSKKLFVDGRTYGSTDGHFSPYIIRSTFGSRPKNVSTNTNHYTNCEWLHQCLLTEKCLHVWFYYWIVTYWNITYCVIQWGYVLCPFSAVTLGDFSKKTKGPIFEKKILRRSYELPTRNLQAVCDTDMKVLNSAQGITWGKNIRVPKNAVENPLKIFLRQSYDFVTRRLRKNLGNT